MRPLYCLVFAGLAALLGCSMAPKHDLVGKVAVPQFLGPVPTDPALSVTSSGRGLAIDFSWTLLHTGKPSAHMFILKNAGIKALTVLGLNKAEGFDSAFQTPSAQEVKQVLQPGETMALTVTFAPTEARDYLATFTLPTSADAESGEPPPTVTLRGSGVDHGCLLAPPDGLDFGNVKAGSRAQKQLTVQNTTPLDWSFTLQGLSGTNPDAFSLDQPMGETVIRSNSSLTIAVTFTAGSPGAATASLQFTSAGDMCGPSPFALHAHSVDSLITATPDPVDFGLVDPDAGWGTAKQDVTLTNIGNDPLHLLPADLGALCDGPWLGSASACMPTAEFATAPDGTSAPGAMDLILAPGASQTMTLYFKPALVHSAVGHAQFKLDSPDQPSFGFSLTGVGATP